MYVVLGGLIVLHFFLKPWWDEWLISPDLLILALLIYSMRARPGAAALVGFCLGLVYDTVSPVAFGSGALAYSVVGYLAAWGRAVFFAENVIVNAAFFFGGSWFIDLLNHTAGGSSLSSILLRHGWWSIWEGVITPGMGVVVLVLFRDVINIRISD
jgi:rod shape-determining protein MreD